MSSAKLRNPYEKQSRDVAMLLNRTGKAKQLYGIERIVLLGLAVLLMGMPSMIVRWLAGKSGIRSRKIGVDAYVVFKPTLLIVLLWTGSATHLWALAVAALFFVRISGHVDHLFRRMSITHFG
jgi:hypothetical protein